MAKVGVFGVVSVREVFSLIRLEDHELVGHIGVGTEK